MRSLDPWKPVTLDKSVNWKINLITVAPGLRRERALRSCFSLLPLFLCWYSVSLNFSSTGASGPHLNLKIIFFDRSKAWTLLQQPSLALCEMKYFTARSPLVGISCWLFKVKMMWDRHSENSESSFWRTILFEWELGLNSYGFVRRLWVVGLWPWREIIFLCLSSGRVGVIASLNSHVLKQ